MERSEKVGKKPPGANEISRKDTARYIHSLLDSLQKVAANKEFSMLSHLIGLAKSEAGRCCEE